MVVIFFFFKHQYILEVFTLVYFSSTFLSIFCFFFSECFAQSMFFVAGRMCKLPCCHSSLEELGSSSRFAVPCFLMHIYPRLAVFYFHLVFIFIFILRLDVSTSVGAEHLKTIDQRTCHLILPYPILSSIITYPISCPVLSHPTPPHPTHPCYEPTA